MSVCCSLPAEVTARTDGHRQLLDAEAAPPQRLCSNKRRCSEKRGAQWAFVRLPKIISAKVTAVGRQTKVLNLSIYIWIWGGGYI